MAMEPSCYINATSSSATQIGLKHDSAVASLRNQTYSAEKVIHVDCHATIYDHANHLQVPRMGNNANTAPIFQKSREKAHQPRRQLYQRLSYVRIDNSMTFERPVLPKTAKTSKGKSTDASVWDPLRGVGAWALQGDSEQGVNVIRR